MKEKITFGLKMIYIIICLYVYGFMKYIDIHMFTS